MRGMNSKRCPRTLCNIFATAWGLGEVLGPSLGIWILGSTVEARKKKSRLIMKHRMKATTLNRVWSLGVYCRVEVT